MIYPENGSPNFGRANLPHFPVLYASWNIRTVLDEVGAEQGDYIQVIALRPIPGIQIPCHIVGEYQSIINSGGSLINSRNLEQYVNNLLGEHDPNWDRILYVDSFLAEAFRQMVKNPLEYKTTAIFSHRFYMDAGGIMYPSVESPRGINLAVPAEVFDRHFEVLFTDVYYVERFYGYSVYEVTSVKHSSKFATDGEINWGYEKTMNLGWNVHRGLQLESDVAGWRKPRPNA
jgi:hypothetical protein